MEHRLPSLSELSDNEKASFIELAAAARSQPHVELSRKLDVAERLFPWIKWVGGLLAAAMAAIVHLELKLAKVPENTEAIRENKVLIQANTRLIDEYKFRLEAIEEAKRGYDIAVVPKIAIWDRTADAWSKFDNGTQHSDLAHLREMWWMKERGLTNKDVHGGTIPTPDQTRR